MSLIYCFIIAFIVKIEKCVEAEMLNHESFPVLGNTNYFCNKLDISETEMKRRHDACEIKGTKKSGNWSLGLIDSMTDPDLIVKKFEDLVVIKDKFPKAKFHYLVIPNEDIGSIFKLNVNHIGLMERFGEMYAELQQENCDVKLRAGFHAVPSMQRLHMHVLSNDMVSPCLKTKHHWNSFTTSFFIPCTELLKELKENGKITRITEEKRKELLETPLQCNQCRVMPKNIPQLKQHLLSHL